MPNCPLPQPEDDSPGVAADAGTAKERGLRLRLSFVVCVSGEAVLAANLMSSPCLAPGSPHEVIPVLDAPSAGAGLNAGRERARYGLVVCVHQDVVLPHSVP
jgi:hypothetical protein